MNVFKKIIFVILCNMILLLHANMPALLCCKYKSVASPYVHNINAHVVPGGYQCTGDFVYMENFMVGCADKRNSSNQAYYHPPSSIKMRSNYCKRIRTTAGAATWSCTAPEPHYRFHVLQINCRNAITK